MKQFNLMRQLCAAFILIWLLPLTGMGQCLPASGVNASGTLNLCSGSSVTLSATLSSNGFVTTYSGTGTSGSADGTLSQATLNGPFGLAFDAAGNMYVAERESHRIRKIAPNGTVSTLAGSTAGFADGNGTLAQFRNPTSVVADAAGNVYVADYGNNRIRKIAPNGNVTTLAGSGTAGNTEGTGTNAQFNGPHGIGIDAAGNLYVSEYSGYRIRRVTPDGTTSNFAGGAGSQGTADGSSTAARFYRPMALVFDISGNMYVSDAGNNRIRKITSGGTVSTLAGSTSGYADGTGTAAQFSLPGSLVTDASGNLYVVDQNNNRIRKITSGGVVTTVAGTLTGNSSGAVNSILNLSTFKTPFGLAADASGNLFVGDYANYLIRKITFSTIGYLWNTGETTQSITKSTAGSYSVQLVAGSCTSAASAVSEVTVSPMPDVPTITASGPLSFCPGGSVTLTSSAATGNLWSTGATTQSITVTGTGVYRVRIPLGICTSVSAAITVTVPNTARVPVITSASFCSGSNPNLSVLTAGAVSTYAGAEAGAVDGVLSAARFAGPVGLTFDAAGNMYIADWNNHRIRKITPEGVVSTFAGSSSGYADGTGTAAKFKNPVAMVMDASGNLFVADQGNHSIRKITPEGVVTTFAGNGTEGTTQGTGSDARFSSPNGITIDNAGNLYVSEYGSGRIRKITPAGTTSTLTDGGTDGALYRPAGVYADVNRGIIYIAEWGSSRVRKVAADGTVSILAGSGASGYTDGTGTAAKFANPAGIVVDAEGNIYVADQSNHRIRKITAEGVVTTLAGLPTGSASGTTDGALNASMFYAPNGLALDNTGNLFVADWSNNRIRKIVLPVSGFNYLWSTGATTSGISPTGPGSYSVQFTSGTCTSAAGTAAVIQSPEVPTVSASGPVSFCYGGSVTLTSSSAGGNIWSNGATTQSITVSTSNTYSVRVTANGCTSAASAPVSVTASFKAIKPNVTASGPLNFCTGGSVTLTASNATATTVSTIAGSGAAGLLNANGTSAKFYNPTDLAFDASGNIYVTDSYYSLIRKITPAGVVTTASSGVFSSPSGITKDSEGNFYISDASVIRKMTPEGTISLLAGGGVGTSGSVTFADGTGNAAKFNNPAGITTDAFGNVYVADQGNHRIRKITPAGVVTTLAGNGTQGQADGTGTAATFNNPSGLAADASGNIYVMDYYNAKIRKITPSGVVSTVVSISGQRITVDPTGNLIVSDVYKISKLTAEGVLISATGLTYNPYDFGQTTFADGAGTDAKFYYAMGTAFDATGNLYVADYSNHRIRKVAIPVTPVSYLWSNGSTGAGITVSTTGSYSVQGIIPGCTSDASTPVAVVLTAMPSTPAITATGPLNICSDNTVTLSSSSATGNLWSNGSYAQSITVNKSGTYSVVRFDGICTSGKSNSITVAVTPAPIAVPTVSPAGAQSFCERNNITLTASALPAASMTVSTLAGSTAGYVNATGTAAKFSSACAVTNDASGNLYVCDRNNHAIRKITAEGVVSTLAGSGSAGFANGNGTAASFNSPSGIAVDASGNVYVGDFGNHVIRKITSSGTVTTLAGSPGTASFADGSATNARFSYPAGLAIDAGGNLYLADHNNRRIRRISPSGDVSTVAGSGVTGPADGTLAAAQFSQPYAVAADESGNIYVVERDIHRIRKINVTTGMVSTLAGLNQGYADGQGTAAKFYYPTAIAIDGTGNLYVCDQYNSRIRKVTPAGAVTTIAGTGTLGTADGPTSSAQFDNPAGITLDAAGNIYIAEATNNRVRKITQTFAATGYLWSNGATTQTISVSEGGNYTVRYIASGCNSAASNTVLVTVNPSPTTPVISASGPLSFCGGGSVTLTSSAGSGNIWSNGATTQSITASTSGTYSVQVTDGTCTSLASAPITVSVTQTPSVPVINASGTLNLCTGGSVTLSYNAPVTTASTLAGGTRGSQNGTGTGSSFYSPYAVTFDPAGNAYVADYDNHRIRKITQAGVVTTFAGSTSGYAEGNGTSAKFYYPTGITADASGNIYVADKYNYRIRKITPNGDVSTYAGSGGYGTTNGPAASATFTGIACVATDAAGNVYVTDQEANMIRKITPDGTVSTFAGSGNYGSTNATGTLASFAYPTGLVADVSGNIYVSEYYGNQIRKITPAGLVSTLAGSTSSGNTDAAGTAARFSSPSGVTADASGNVYVADFGNHRIRKITPAGLVTTVAGSYAGFNDGIASAALFYNPRNLAFDANGNLFIADNSNNRIRKITLPETVTEYLWSNGATTPGITVNASGNYTLQTINGTCTSAASAPSAVTVTTTPNAPTASASGPLTFCSGGSVTLTSSEETGNYWNTGATTQSITVASSGNYTVRSILSACTSAASNTVSVTVTSTPGTPTVNVTGSLSFCSGGSVTLTSSSASSYIWSTGETTRIITVTGSGTYTVRTISSGCTSNVSAARTVTVTETPAKPEITGQTVLCSGDNVTLTSSAASGNKWSNGATTQSITVSAAGTYTVFAINGTCTSATSNPTIVTNGTLPGTAGAISGSEDALQISTETYSLTPISGANAYSWTYNGTGVTISQNGTSATLTFSGTATSGRLSVSGTNVCGNGTASFIDIFVSEGNDLRISATRTVSGSYRNVTVVGTPVITLGGNLTVEGNFTVPSGATLVTGCNTIDGPGSFILSAGAKLVICNTDGIAQTGNAGAVRTTTRNFNPGADYEYNGISAQVTGTGLPAKVRNLTVSTGVKLTLSQPSGVTNTLNVSAGEFFLDNKVFTLHSDASGTARLDEVLNGVTITGAANFTAQRWFDPTVIRTGNNGGYYWVASPVTGKTITAWQTPLNIYAGTTFSGGSNNSSAWLYSNSNNTYPANAGWVKPASATVPANPGTGFRIWFLKNFLNTAPTVSLAGPPSTGTVNLPVTYCSGTCAGNSATSGWNLVGNPYPSTIDWDDADWVKTNMANSLYILREKLQSYATYIGGIGANGGSRYIASGQGFEVLATGTSPVLRASEGVKTAQTADILRSSAQSLLRMSLTDGNYTDEAVVNHKPEAIRLYDSQFDAPKLMNYSGLNLWIEPAADMAHIISAMQISAGDSLTLVMRNRVSGRVRLAATELSDWAEKFSLSILDNSTGNVFAFTAGTELPFMLNAGESYRLTLLFGPA
ncbi:MAG: hypothetical protein V4543_07820, partial [Bacteroidota bacterium]